MINSGNCVRTMKVGNTRIRICDDYCRDKTPEEVDQILKRVAQIALNSFAAAQMREESAQNERKAVSM